MEKIKVKTCILFFVLVFFAVIFGGILGGLLAGTVNTKNVENFIEFNPALPTRLLDINGEVITEFASDEKREMISIDRLPQHMIDSLVTREDRIFYEHNGFSLKAVLRAVVGKLTVRTLGGGSTLSQQIAGSLYCDRTEMSYMRKIKELWWAFQMERRYSKDEIMELYLNRIYFGGGTYGVNAASKYYFGHDATKITPAESAILVIQLSNPAYYNPFDHPNRARERQQDVLYSMVKNGYITQEEADESYDEYWSNFDLTRISTSAYFSREDKAPWFSEYVRRELTGMMYGSNDITTGGYTVNTTMNLKHQQAAQEIMEARIAYANRIYARSSSERKTDASKTYIPMTELFSLVFDIPQLKFSSELNETTAKAEYKKELNPVLDVLSLMFNIEPLKVGVVNVVNSKQKQDAGKTTIEGTLVTLENDTGYITALVGGSKFNSENQFIRATQAKIQPGSTFKPLYYSAAIDSRKFTAVTQIDDSPYIFTNEDGTPYYPENFRGEWAGNVQLWYALAKSMNVPSLKILEGIGFDAAINRAVALLGIPEKEIPERALTRTYPVGLGTASVRPIELARAYAIYANQGREVTPIAIRSVEDRTGKVFLNPEKELRLEQKRKGAAIQVISPQTAFIMTDILRNSVRIGTMAWGTRNGTRLQYKDKNGREYMIPAAGKTGTTQNWASAWAAGYTPYLTTVIWFGFDKVGQSLGLELTGSTLSGVAWGDYMRICHEDLPMKEFPVPQTGLVKASVCSVSGEILTAACGDHVTTKYFLEGTEPKTVCKFHTSREDAKALGEIRISRARYLSSETLPKITDKSPLKLDLKALGINLEYDEQFDKKPAGNINANSSSTVKKLPSSGGTNSSNKKTSNKNSALKSNNTFTVPKKLPSTKKTNKKVQQENPLFEDEESEESFQSDTFFDDEQNIQTDTVNLETDAFESETELSEGYNSLFEDEPSEELSSENTSEQENEFNNEYTEVPDDFEEFENSLFGDSNLSVEDLQSAEENDVVETTENQEQMETETVESNLIDAH